MKFIVKLLLSYCIAIIPTGIIARDVNLDSIYINNSALSNKLKDLKLGAYSSAKSFFVSDNVAFAHWIKNDEILFIEDLAKSASIFRYKFDGSRTLICSIPGMVTVSVPSTSGKYLYLKTIEIVNHKPLSYFIVVDIEKSTFVKKPSSYPFLDFTVSPKYDAYIHFDGKAFIETKPDGSSEKILDDDFPLASSSGLHQTLLLYSPNQKNKLIFSGSDANYKSIILGEHGVFNFEKLSSASEVFWIDDNRILFQSGHTGSFNVNLLNYRSNRSRTILDNSLNTNIRFSPIPKTASFLDHQLINIYNIPTNKTTSTGLEGEDVSFSPNGLSFTSLLYKRLYITQIAYTKKYREEILSHSHNIVAIYTQILNNESYWQNEYTPEYCRKKISAYRRLNRGAGSR